MGISTTFDIWALLSGFFQLVKVTGGVHELSIKTVITAKSPK
jgi:hypothetical protein